MKSCGASSWRECEASGRRPCWPSSSRSAKAGSGCIHSRWMTARSRCCSYGCGRGGEPASRCSRRGPPECRCSWGANDGPWALGGCGCIATRARGSRRGRRGRRGRSAPTEVVKVHRVKTWRRRRERRDQLRSSTIDTSNALHAHATPFGNLPPTSRGWDTRSQRRFDFSRVVAVGRTGIPELTLNVLSNISHALSVHLSMVETFVFLTSPRPVP